MVFSTKFMKIFSTNIFLDGKATHGHNLNILAFGAKWIKYPS
jgi:hypothetical protein